MKPRIRILLALALAGALVMPARAENARAVRVQPVALTQQRESVTYSGTVGARIMVDLAFRIAGKVVARSVNISDHVTRNQIIARLDPTDQRLQAAHAESAVTAAEADAANARAMFLRYEKMGRGSSAFVDSEYDARLAAMRATAARLEQARRQLEMAEDQSQYTDLRADADGVITALPVEPGQVVTAGQPTATLAHNAETEITVDVPETRLKQVREAVDVVITLWAAPEQPLHGRVREIGSLANAASRTFAVKISVPDLANSLISLGMTATARFEGPPGMTHAVLPAGALTAAHGKPAVWVLNEATHRAVLTPVQLIAVLGDGSIEVGGGLSSGQFVVTAGADLLDADMPVTAWQGPTR